MKRVMAIAAMLLGMQAFGIEAGEAGEAGEASVPHYPPSSWSPVPVDITSNEYGESYLAPFALELGDISPDFSLPVSGGGSFRLSGADRFPVVIIFYRGHW